MNSFCHALYWLLLPLLPHASKCVFHQVHRGQRSQWIVKTEVMFRGYNNKKQLQLIKYACDLCNLAVLYMLTKLWVATTLLLGLPKCSLTFHNDASCLALLLHHAYFTSHHQFVLIWSMPTVTHVYLTSCTANNLSKQWQPMLCCMAWLFHYVE